MQEKYKTNQILNIILVSIFTVGILLSVGQMLSLAFPYLVPPFPTDIDFLESKQWVVEKWHWLAAFYIHISSAIITLAAGLTQFSKAFMKRFPVWHRKIGKLYVFVVLFVAGPSGFVMAFYGNGGLLAQYAFIAQAIAWWWLTYMAYHRIIKGDLKGHCKFMIRSYAMTLSAISLRAATYIVSLWKFNNGITCPNITYSLICYPDFYILIAWLSWVVNLLIAEFLILIGIVNYYLPAKRV
ncbi:MAG: DUF2306 domain-containing protein [Saprospiraceae bacterium]|nr:DUF2306 domain-containing protein [Saprospiraceae bacterium]